MVNDPVFDRIRNMIMERTEPQSTRYRYLRISDSASAVCSEYTIFLSDSGMEYYLGFDGVAKGETHNSKKTRRFKVTKTDIENKFMHLLGENGLLKK